MPIETPPRDSRNHVYVEVENCRLTFVPAADRAESKNWAGSDVIRIQARRGDDSDALHRGAELPVGDSNAVLNLVAAICRLYSSR